MTIQASAETWQNWAGNQFSQPRQILKPASEQEVEEILRAAVEQGVNVRVVGAGHSFSPLVVTDGFIVSLENLAGVRSTDLTAQRAVVGPGTRIRDLGDPLWDAGLCLRNQGDIDAQHIAGAVNTATHGSGKALQSFAGAVRRVRMVTPGGGVLDVGEDDPQLLAAASVSLGLLGIITEMELQVREAFAMSERIEWWPLEKILSNWKHEAATRRHFSFFWWPADDAPDRLFMDSPADLNVGDMSMVKLYDEHPADRIARGDDVVPADDLSRLDRPYRIYPDPDFQGEIVMRELEYMVPYARGQEAFLALRRLILEKYPDNNFPIEFRTIDADGAYLSPFYQRPSVSISICGHKYLNFMEFLADVHTTLLPFEPLPHWGKIHFFDRETLRSRMPRYDEFVDIRRRLDPGGLLLSPSLAPLFE